MKETLPHREEHSYPQIPFWFHYLPYIQHITLKHHSKDYNEYIFKGTKPLPYAPLCSPMLAYACLCFPMLMIMALQYTMLPYVTLYDKICQ